MELLAIAEPPITAPHRVLAPDLARAHPRAWRGLATILLLGMILRGGLVGWFHGQPLVVDDERSYAAIATNLASNGEFAYAPGQLTSLRPPLYPALVAGVFSVCGLDNYDAVRIVQSVLSLATVGLVFYLARLMFGQTTALWAAGLTCFYPSLVGASCLILTETLFTFLIVVLVTLVVIWLQTGSLSSLMGIGLVLGLASLTRSILWLFPPLLMPFLVIAMRGQPWPRRLVHAVIPIAIFAITITPWAVRNSLLQKTFVTVDVMGGRNFMMGNYEYTPLYRAWDAISATGDRSWDSVLARSEPTYSQTTQGQRDKLALRYGLRYALAHPAQTMHRSIIKFCNFWQLERELVAGASRGNWGVSNRWVVLGLALVIVGFYAASTLAGIFGFLLSRPQIAGIGGFILLLVAFVCLIHSVVFGHSRYHLPLMPLVLIYAASAIVRRQEIWDRRNHPAFRLASMLCALLVATWVWELWFVEPGRLVELL